MSDTAIDVLVFLFDNYLDAEMNLAAEEDSLEYELEQAGFPVGEIHKAFDWLGDLADVQSDYDAFEQMDKQSQRVFTARELRKLDKSSRGFLMHLEKLGLLDPTSREIILDRAMAIDVDELSLDQFKRVVGLVMLNRPSHDAVLAWVEDLIYDELGGVVLH
jgi:Smg protein